MPHVSLVGISARLILEISEIVFAFWRQLLFDPSSVFQLVVGSWELLDQRENERPPLTIIPFASVEGVFLSKSLSCLYHFAPPIHVSDKARCRRYKGCAKWYDIFLGKLKGILRCVLCVIFSLAKFSEWTVDHTRGGPL